MQIKGVSRKQLLFICKKQEKSRNPNVLRLHHHPHRINWALLWGHSYSMAVDANWGVKSHKKPPVEEMLRETKTRVRFRIPKPSVLHAHVHVAVKGLQSPCPARPLWSCLNRVAWCHLGQLQQAGWCETGPVKDRPTLLWAAARASWGTTGNFYSTTSYLHSATWTKPLHCSLCSQTSSKHSPGSKWHWIPNNWANSTGSLNQNVFQGRNFSGRK